MTFSREFRGAVARALIAGLGLAAGGLGVLAGGAATAKVEFNRDIRPILADHCFNCHGADEKSRKANLRLDTREGALQGGKSGRASLAPGQPGESELLRRVVTHDEDDLMPPPSAKNPLSAAAIEKLRRWITDGAEYQGHWAFTAPERSTVPEESGLDLPQGRNFRVRSPIDAFVLARLREEGMRPSPEAPPEVLCRRLFLDLTGLPPSPKELDDFIEAYGRDGDAAFERLVDRLTGSEAFAERWARWWLDAARYADSDGYEKDLPREQWAWRDWVIQAFRRDMPYDRFVVEQLAGDLLPAAGQSEQVATGFLRNGMVNEEGAILAEQFRMEGMYDRMDTVGKSILGLSIQCGQCHTHKFDPLTHEEYYQMFAALNDTFESTMGVYSPEQQETIDRIHRVISDAEAEIKRRFPDWPERLAQWIESERSRRVNWEVIDAIELDWPDGLAHPEKIKDKSILTLGFRPTSGDLWATAIIAATNVTGVQFEALTHGDLPFRGPGRSHKGTFAVSELVVEAAPVSAIGANTNQAAQIKSGLVKISLTNAWADVEGADQPVDARARRGDKDKRRLGPAKYLVDGQEDTAWSADLGPGRRNVDSRVVMEFATNGWASVEGTFLKFTLKFRHGGSDGHGRDNNFLGRFRLSLTSDPHAGQDKLPRRIRELVEKSHRSEAEQGEVFSWWRTQVPDFAQWNERIQTAWKEYPEATNTVLNLAQREPDLHRQTFILDRGNWEKPTRAVEPGVPAFLHDWPSTDDPPRLAFARWLVDSRSPTTARVAVNRVWQAMFGMGLLETAEDFGVRAPMPVHLDLLDWLASEFVEPASDGRPWSIKHLVRTIVRSSTYRQASRLDAGLIERDPKNQLLARAPRFRADAEVIRDVALSAAGLLEQRLGGPSFYPPVPENLFALNFVKLDWKAAPAPERYRRSLYLFRRRSMPDPVMGSFDAPNGDLACVRRPRSNTPLAALTSLNEPVFYEAAQALALRTLREAGASEGERAAYAFRLCTGRRPRGEEVDTLLEFLRTSRSRLAEGWVSARELAFGDTAAAPKLPAGVTPADAASWTLVARVLLNLDETVSRN